ncbi:hypothetical protein PAXRUDRAFT_135929 [Paxillus rubicundulus Ve08.2h10]|uniref:Uncharacterized protein n=1 Tax=Paxillus rubicundulus Ve08.2h10 TaxID=930991 RepID=A0A0D0E1F0_9AGAM|nr:hypothetical protein PAXRUDRAFT_135929 [Paxillus rubicundulus Ve08.2h10]
MSLDQSFILHPSCILNYEPNVTERQAITAYLTQVIGGRTAEIQKNLPTSMSLWGKVHILSGGNAVWSHFAARLTAQPIQNSSYIQVRVTASQQYNLPNIGKTHRLEKILVFSLPDARIWRNLAGRMVVVALVMPCQTHGKNATQERTSYSQTLAMIATDLRNIKVVVGCCKTRRNG